MSKIVSLVKFQMMGNQHALNAQLVLHAIPEIQLVNQLVQLECTLLKGNLLANPALPVLCALTQQELEYLSVLMELSHNWDLLSVLTAPRASFVHSKIKQ